MNHQNLIIYNLPIMYEILLEVENNLNFELININSEEFLNFKEEKYKNFIFLTKKKNLNVRNQLIITDIPIRFTDLIEKINIKFLKINYQGQSNHLIQKYTVDLNSKKFSKDNKSLKLTEKEISTILYLAKNKKPISVKELQINVWDHKSELETHTVETHIHRLRKKIKEKFNDENLIISSKEGYLIN